MKPVVAVRNLTHAFGKGALANHAAASKGGGVHSPTGNPRQPYSGRCRAHPSHGGRSAYQEYDHEQQFLNLL